MMIKYKLHIQQSRVWLKNTGKDEKMSQNFHIYMSTEAGDEDIH